MATSDAEGGLCIRTTVVVSARDSLGSRRHGRRGESRAKPFPNAVGHIVGNPVHIGQHNDRVVELWIEVETGGGAGEAAGATDAHGGALPQSLHAETEFLAGV